MAADGVRRRGVAGGNFNYEQALVHLGNFVDNELGNGGLPGGNRGLPGGNGGPPGGNGGPPGGNGGPPGGNGRPPDLNNWRIQRRKSIRKLNELRNKLDDLCVGANCGKCVGTGAEIIGTAGRIIGSLLSLTGQPVGQLVTNVGSLVSNSGTFIDGISKEFELIYTKDYLNEIDAVLKKDKELSEPLANWLDFSNNLDANVREIFGVSLEDEKLSIVLKVFLEFSTLSNSYSGFDETLKLLSQGRYAVHIGTDVAVGKLQKFFQHLSASPELSVTMRKILLFFSVSTEGIQAFRDGVRIYRFFSPDTSRSEVPRSYQAGEIPTVREVSGFCVIQTIMLAISVVSFINARNIIRHGKSKYSDAIKTLVDALEWELRRMEEF